MAKEKKQLKPKVLIVEDEPALLRAIEFVFDREGFEVIKAEDGGEAIDKALKDRPDAVVLDLVLPHIDGVTFLRKLREDRWGIDLPVLVYSNVSHGKTLEEVEALGVADVFVKTDRRLSEVVARVKQMLQK
jgi:DNA-binding response OmpR family regulator